MKTQKMLMWSAAIAILVGFATPLLWSQAEEPPPRKPVADEAKDPATEQKAEDQAARPAIKPKQLGEHTKKGLAWLVSQQHTDGGWGQGGGWRVANQGGRVQGADVQDPPDVGSTAAATLALIRAGNTPTKGEYAKNVAKAVEFISSHIEKSDEKSLYITDVRGTQLQSKIGQYVDTFLATLVLSELKGQMPDAKSEKRLLASLDKTIGKIEKNQKGDGTFAGNSGWASVLSQGICSAALNRARQSGVMVKSEVLEKDLNQAVAGLDVKTGEFSKPAAVAATPSPRALAGTAGPVPPAAGPGLGDPAAKLPTRATGRPAAPTAASAPSDAGVAIYSLSAKTRGLQDAVNTNQQQLREAQQVLADASAPAEAKEAARRDLDRFAEVAKAQQSAVRGIIKRLDDKQFIAGFGNNGGEEFLSYMNISETLFAQGGTDWLSWDKSITENLNRIQDPSGSWSGHHCITGRTFCTAAALLTLMADRAPIPVAAK